MTPHSNDIGSLCAVALESFVPAMLCQPCWCAAFKAEYGRRQESVAENKILAGVSCLGAFHFLIIADGSLCEVPYMIIFCAQVQRVHIQFA